MGCNMEQELREIRQMISEIYTVLLGDPTDPKKLGHHTRLDRLEQSNNFKNKLLWLLGSGTILLLINTLKETIWTH